MTSFLTEAFYGSVVLKDWLRWHDGRQFIGITGKLTVLEDEAIVGFRTRGGESNWLVRVEGEFESLNILGCQIRAVHTHAAGGQSPTDYLVIP